MHASISFGRTVKLLNVLGGRGKGEGGTVKLLNVLGGVSGIERVKHAKGMKRDKKKRRKGKPGKGKGRPPIVTMLTYVPNLMHRAFYVNFPMLEAFSQMSYSITRFSLGVFGSNKVNARAPLTHFPGRWKGGAPGVLFI